MHKTRTILLWSILTLFLLTISVVIAYALTLKYCTDKNTEPIIRKPIESVTGPVPLGRKLYMSAEIETLWGRIPVSMEMNPGEGSQTVTEPVIKKHICGWGKTCWKVSFSIQPYHFEKIPEGSLQIQFEGGPKKETIRLKVPSFSASSVPLADGKLVFADPLSKPQKKSVWPYWAAAGAALLLIVLIVWIFKRRNRKEKERVITIWEHALQAIDSLKDVLHSGKTRPEQAIAVLNDLVRNYLEKRFNLRAEHQTTREFLDEIGQGGPLSDEQTGFLKNFLASSDLIKFARLPANEQDFDRAANEAGILIRSTIPPAEKKGE